MRILINKEEAKQIGAHSFSVAPTTGGFTIAYSADGISFTNYSEATPANEVLLVNGCPKNAWWKLVGNVDDNVVVTF